MFYEDPTLYMFNDHQLDEDDFRAMDDEIEAYKADAAERERSRREIERRGDRFAVTNMGDAFRNALMRHNRK